MEEKKNRPEEIHLSPEIIKYESILAKDPKSVVFAPLADAYRKAGMLDDAFRVCTEGLKYHPDHAGGRVVLGRIYFEKGLYAEARLELENALRLSPENIVARKLLGEIYLIQGDQKRALEEFDRVLFLNPGDKEVSERIRLLKESSGGEEKHEVAVKKEEEEIEDLEGELVVNEEGLVLQMPEEEKEDISADGFVIKSAEEIFEEDREEICTLTLAEIYREQKLYDKAIEVYEKLLKKEPDNIEVRTRYESLLKELKGEPEETKESIEIKILEEWLEKVRRIYSDRF